VGILLRIAWRNLLRSWRRSAIVISAVSVGLIGCLLLMAWTVGMFNQMSDTAVRTQLAHVAVHSAGYHANPDLKRSLPELWRTIVRELSARPGVRSSPRLTGEGLIQSARRSSRTALVGVIPALERRVSSVAESVIEGTYFEIPPSGRASRLPSIVIGIELAERLRVGLGDKVVVRGPGEAGLGAFRVGGLYRTVSSAFDRVFVFMRIEDAQRLLNTGDRATEVVAILDDPGVLPAFISWARERLSQVFPDQQLEVLSWQEREPRIAAILSMTDEIRWIFYSFVFVAMAFGIANALLMAVYERIREFGVLRSLGLRARRLVVLVLLESLLLTLVGTFVGLAVGFAVVAWIGEVGIDLSLFSEALRELGIGVRVYPALDPLDIVVPIAFAGGTAAVAAVWPALKAARLRPAEAVRHV
jgi:ABC-type lipoprotein release transport system permease subunit